MPELFGVRRRWKAEVAIRGGGYDRAVWVWDGRTWQLAVPRRPDRPGLFWFFSAPRWFEDYVVMALIGLIPIAGVIVLLGWYMAARDNLRAGYWILPKAGFDHIERGARLYVPQLVYSLAFYALYAAVGLAVLIAALLRAPLIVYAVPLVGFVAGWVLLAVLIGYLSAAMFAVADAQGIRAALNPARVWALAGRSPGASWGVFGTYLLGIVLATLISFVVPFFSIAAVPAVFLMAAPAQARFDDAATPAAR